MLFTVTVNVAVPALDSFVQYLRDRDKLQQEIDALAAQLASFTSGLHQSSTGLQGAVDSNSKS